MKFYTKSGSYFEVREVNSNLYRIFYCWEKNHFYYGQKKGEKMISSQDTRKKAYKIAQHFQKIYNMGYSDGTGW